jgi:hypothetical protein
LLVKRVTPYWLKEAGPEFFPKAALIFPLGSLNLLNQQNTTLGKVMTSFGPATAMEADSVSSRKLIVHPFPGSWFLFSG